VCHFNFKGFAVLFYFGDYEEGTYTSFTNSMTMHAFYCYNNSVFSTGGQKAQVSINKNNLYIKGMEDNCLFSPFIS
jgi:hypothetical protein